MDKKPKVQEANSRIRKPSPARAALGAVMAAGALYAGASIGPIIEGERMDIAQAAKDKKDAEAMARPVARHGVPSFQPGDWRVAPWLDAPLPTEPPFTGPDATVESIIAAQKAAEQGTSTTTTTTPQPQGHR